MEAKNRNQRNRNQQNANSKSTQRNNRENVKTKPMKLSMLKFKVTVLFMLMSALLIFISMMYDKKNQNYQIYIGDLPTEYISEDRAGLDRVKLSIIQPLGSFVHHNESEAKDIIVLPSNEILTVDYVTKTISNDSTGEKIESTFDGESIEHVLISLEDLKKFTCFKFVEDSGKKTIVIENVAKESLAEKLLKQSQDSYFNDNMIVEYFNFMLKYPELQSYDAILAVNIGLYRPFYADPIEINNESDYTALVNKYYSLPNNYAPVDLMDKGDSKQLRQKAYSAFDSAKADMAKDGLNLYLISAYRSYARQTTLYNNYVAQDGVEKADEFSARPGHSEHQTGLSMDVMHTTNIDKSLSNTHFENTVEYKWLVDNGYKYGLILRYPLGKENITGYMYEPWHWRYVGEDVAQFMKDNEIETLEEFHALKGSTEAKFPELDMLSEVATAVTQVFIMDDRNETLNGYEIHGYVYYNVADIADFVRTTKYQFKPIYEPNSGEINLVKSLSSEIRTLDVDENGKTEGYKESEINLLVDNFEVETQYPTYIINSDFYINLVDVTNLLSMDLKWNYETNSFNF